MPNVLISILIGIANETFFQVVFSSLSWGFVWIAYSIIIKSVWIEENINKGMSIKGWSYKKSKLLALLIEYFSVAIMTVLPLSLVIQLIKSLLT